MANSKRSTIPLHWKEKVVELNARLQHEIVARERAEKERVEALEGLKEVRERFETAFGNAPIGMAFVDMHGRWLLVNEALCRITGYSRDELKATTKCRRLYRPVKKS